MPNHPRRALFGRGTWAEDSRIAVVLRKETVGGVLLLVATVVALTWSNSPWSQGYAALGDTTVGPASLHLDLTLATWAADGLLALFFFVAGLELKREFVAGDLRDPRRAALPVAAAVGGVIVPALIYLGVTLLGGGAGDATGWAIPTATDIAFALAVLAVAGTFLPTALRTFLLTLAVVDDLLAITIIAFFYTDHLSPVPLVLALLPLAAFTVLVRRHVRSGWLLLPLAVTTWALVHASGVHATVAGVLLGFAVPVARGIPGEGRGLAEHFEHLWRPLSAGVAVPVFAFFSAGVTVGGFSGLSRALHDPVALGIVGALILGKPIGILLATVLTSRFTKASLSEDLGWIDVVGLAVLGGIGFTVSLLIGELAFGTGSQQDEHAKVAVLVGSVVAALAATVLLRIRNGAYRRICADEAADQNADGIPDVYETSGTGQREVAMPGATRGFLGRPRRVRDARLPPGQYDVGSDWPVLTAEVTPHLVPERWTMSVDGLVENPVTLTWDEMHALPQSEYAGDIHCVTTWSKLGTSFQGVSVDLLLDAARPRPEAAFVLATSTTGYTTNLPLEDVRDGKAWVVWSHEGRPLTAEHGGPVRLLVPHLYFWKSAKWVTRLTLLDHDEPGFWERNGYHDRGDPWREQRYQGD